MNNPRPCPALLRGLLPLPLLAALAACQEPNAPPAAQEGAAQAPAPVAPAPPPVPAPDAQEEARREASQFCNIESVAGARLDGSPPRVSGMVDVRGWLGHADATPVTAAFLEASASDGASGYRTPVQPSLPREDVRQAFPGRDELANSGFQAMLDLGGAAPGDYHLFLVYEAGGRSYVCDNGRHVII